MAAPSQGTLPPGKDPGTMGAHVVVRRSEWMVTKDIRLWDDMRNVELPESLYSTWNHTPPTSFVYTQPMWPLKNVVVIMRWKPAGASGTARELPPHLQADADNESDSDRESIDDEEVRDADATAPSQAPVGARVQRAVWTTPASASASDASAGGQEGLSSASGALPS